MEQVRPRPNTLIGLTHTRDGIALVREPRTIKVGIGIAKGRAIQVFIFKNEWHVRFGQWVKDPAGGKDKLKMVTVVRASDRKEAEAYYLANRDKAAVSNRPQELPYFTFTKRRISVETGKPVEVFEPDFDAIEQHGECPQSIDIILMNDNPLKLEFAMWSQTELRCHGDGLVALRIAAMGTKDQQDECKRTGEKYFVHTPCDFDGCPLRRKECKPNGVLEFQLASSLRIGSTAYFTTTGEVSCGQLFSNVLKFKEWAEFAGGSIRGLPVRMNLSSFKANHNGIPAVKPCVSLEMRAQDMAALKKMLLESVWTPKMIGAAPLQIQSADEDVVEVSTEAMAPAIAAEFYPDATESDDEEDGEEAPAPASTAAAATETKTSALAEKLKASKERKTTAKAVPPEAAPAPAPVAAPVDHVAEPEEDPLPIDDPGSLF